MHAEVEQVYMKLTLKKEEVSVNVKMITRQKGSSNVAEENLSLRRPPEHESLKKSLIYFIFLHF